MSTYIILVNWNGWRDTVQCLESLYRLKSIDFRIIVCDNASTDGSIAALAAWSASRAESLPALELTHYGEPDTWRRWVEGTESLILVQTGKNLGFSGGNNVGIRLALSDPACEYLWLLNNDTVVDPDALEALQTKALSDPKIGAVGSVCYFASDPSKVQSWGGARVNLWTGFVRTNTTPKDDAWFDYIYGASLLLRREAVTQTGLMDETYFLYYEETDYCLRLKQHWRLAVARNSRVIHKVNASTKARPEAREREFTRSGLLLLERHSPFPWVAMPTFLALRMGRRIMRLQWKRLWHVWMGVVIFGDLRSSLITLRLSWWL